MKKLKTIDFYLIGLLIFTLLAVSLRSYAALTSFNPITMHYDEKGAITAASIIAAVAVLGFMSYFFVGPKENNLISRADNAASYIPLGVLSVCMMFLAVDKFSAALSGRFDLLLTILSIISGIFALISVGSFFLSVFIEKNDNIYKSAFSICVVVFLAIYAAFLYFNKLNHPTNSPNKLFDEMAYLFSALFFLYEARITLVRSHWRLYVSFGLSAAMLTYLSAIPSLIVYFVNGYELSDSIFESALTLAVAVYISSRVIQTRRLSVNAVCEEAEGFERLAVARERQIEDTKVLSHAQDNTIIEENDTPDTENYTFDIPFEEPTTQFAPDEAEDNDSGKQ